MTTKIYSKKALTSLLMALAVTASPALARDDLGNCYRTLSSHVAKADIKAPNRELFILIDRTTRSSADLRKELIDKTLRYLQRGDRVSIVTFSAYSNRHYTKLVFTGTLEERPMHTDMEALPIKKAKAFDRCMQIQWKKGKLLIAKRLLDVMTKEESEDYDYKQTELIGTLNTLAKDLIQRSKAQDRTALIFSDMISNSSLTSFFDNKRRVRLISPGKELKKVKAAGMIPNLENTKVFIIGSGYIEKGKLYQDAHRMKALRTFWEKFFQEAKASLKGYGEPMLLTELE